jgi:protein TonB
MKKPIASLFFIFFLLTSCGNKRPPIKEKNSITPLFFVQPAYPRKAAVAGIEGWVKVQFTLTKTGRVKEPVVIDSKPKGIFDREAIRALLRSVFKPWIEKGEAVEYKATHVFEFTLEK